VRLQLRGVMGMIMRLQHVVGVIVLVTLFACGMTVAVAVLMDVRMGVRVRMLMIVNGLAMVMLMPVSVGMPMLVLMPVLVLMPMLVTGAHPSISFACLCLHGRDRRSGRVPTVRSVSAVLLFDRVLSRVRGWQACCNRRLGTYGRPAARGACRSRRGLPNLRLDLICIFLLCR
jgi:hypothetical protein